MSKEENNNHAIIEIINSNGDLKLTKIRNPQAIWQNNDYPDEFIFRDVDYINIFQLIQENKQLKEQLEYIRSEEYYNQLRFERDMLQNLVDNGEISKEDKEFIDCTHRNAELLEENKQFKEQINNIIEIIENCCRNEYYYKYNNRYLKSEIIEQLKEALNYE